MVPTILLSKIQQNHKQYLWRRSIILLILFAFLTYAAYDYREAFNLLMLPPIIVIVLLLKPKGKSMFLKILDSKSDQIQTILIETKTKKGTANLKLRLKGESKTYFITMYLSAAKEIFNELKMHMPNTEFKIDD